MRKRNLHLHDSNATLIGVSNEFLIYLYVVSMNLGKPENLASIYDHVI